MNTIEESELSLPISSEHRRIALEFASEQPTAAKAESVMRNTLAVLAIRDYLEMMGIATNVAESDCWNAVMRLCANVADLHIAGVGKLECRSLTTGESSCYMPPEVWEDRIGYTIVRIEPDLRSASLLGMVYQASSETILLDRLEPIENLCVAISALQVSKQSHIQLDCSHPPVNLRNWLQGVFETGWQELEAIFREQRLQPAWRSTALWQEQSDAQRIRRAKLLNQEIRLGAQSIALVVTLSERDLEQTSVHLAIYPTTESFLPEFLSLKVLDDTGNLFLEARSRRQDNYIQLQLSGSHGENFSIQISLGETMLLENFTL